MIRRINVSRVFFCIFIAITCTIKYIPGHSAGLLCLEWLVEHRIKYSFYVWKKISKLKNEWKGLLYRSSIRFYMPTNVCMCICIYAVKCQCMYVGSGNVTKGHKLTTLFQVPSLFYHFSPSSRRRHYACDWVWGLHKWQF